MKPYIKPNIEYIELRAEESLAAALSNSGINNGPDINGLLNGLGNGLKDQNPGKGKGKP
ncbi:MAG: hypothetical protein WA131_01415 [Desulfitobacteriaceae bacterium]